MTDPLPLVVDLAKTRPVFRPETLPRSLRDLGRRFVVWGNRIEEKRWPSKASAEAIVRKWSKQPIGAKNSDPESWIGFDDALRRARLNACGIGYATLNGPLTGVDLDHVLNARGKLHKPFAEWIALLSKITYVERSPSGHGIRALLRGAGLPADSFDWYEGERTPDDRNKRGVEIYTPESTRYVTLTGDRLLGSRKEIGTPSAAQWVAIKAAIDTLRARAAKYDGEAAPAPGATDDRSPADLARRLHAKGYLKHAKVPRPTDGGMTWWKLTECLHPQCESQTGCDVGLTPENALRVVCHNTGCPMEKSKSGHKRERAEVARVLDVLLKWTPKINGRAALDLSPFSEIERKLIDWVWRPWVAVGVLTLFAGQQGVGKSYLLAHLAACLTRGRMLPDGRTKPGKCIVLYGTSEDDVEATLKARLEQFDADTRYVVPVERSKTVGEPAAWLPGVLDRVRKLAWRRPVVVILDALDSFLLTEEANSSAEVRQRLDALLAIAREKRAAVIGVKHLNKRTTEGDPLYRISGSSSYSEVPRIVWSAAKHEIQRGHVVVETTKCNIGPAGLHFEYSIKPGLREEDPPVVTFLGDTGRTLNDCKAPKHLKGNSLEALPEHRQLHVQKMLYEQELKLTYGELRDFIARTENVSSKTAERDIRTLRRKRQIRLKSRGGCYAAVEPAPFGLAREGGVSEARVKPCKSAAVKGKRLPQPHLGRGATSNLKALM